jgi:hypothetical protein
MILWNLQGFLRTKLVRKVFKVKSSLYLFVIFFLYI